MISVALDSSANLRTVKSIVSFLLRHRFDIKEWMYEYDSDQIGTCEQKKYCFNVINNNNSASQVKVWFNDSNIFDKVNC
jgi:hypothetical protein